jgi:hypothetical protein
MAVEIEKAVGYFIGQVRRRQIGDPLGFVRRITA